MAIAFDAASSGVVNGTTNTVSHTCSGSDRYLLVAVVSRADPTISGVTYNGVAMSFLGSDAASNVFVSMWGLAAPATGANNVVASHNSAITGVMAMSFTDVDQTTSLGTVATANGNSTAPSLDVSSATGELVAYFGDSASSGALTYTEGAGQTSRINEPAWAFLDVMWADTEAGATTVTMSGTLSAEKRWALTGVSLKPVSGGGPTGNPWYYYAQQ